MAAISARAERSSGQLTLIVSALLLIVAFFLPWVNTSAASPSGLGIASGANVLQGLGGAGDGIGALLFLAPLIGLVVLGLSFVRQPMAGPLSAVAGLLAFALLVVFLIQVTRTPAVLDAVKAGGTPLPFIGAGMWIALIAVIAISVGGMLLATRYLAPATALNTRRIVTSGVLGAIAITLGVTQLGFIPVPNLTARATIMHIPAIIGAALEGPVVGIVTGGIFGVFSWLQDTTGLFANPIISVVPRLLIGLMAWLVYRSLERVNVDLAAAVAGVVGTLTNSILVVGLLVAFGLIPAAAVPTIIPQAVAELVLAAVLTPLVVRAVRVTRSGRTVAPDTTPRDKSYY